MDKPANDCHSLCSSSTTTTNVTASAAFCEETSHISYVLSVNILLRSVDRLATVPSSAEGTTLITNDGVRGGTRLPVR